MKRIRTVRGMILLTGLLALGLIAGLVFAAPLTIDLFDTGTMELIATTGGTPDVYDTAVPGSGVLGNERDVEAHIIDAPSGSARVFTNIYTAQGVFSHSQDDYVTGYSVVTWDGEDGSALSLDPTGLGGVDLTAGNTIAGFGVLQVSQAPAAPLVITVTTDAANYSVYEITTEEGNYKSYFAPYADFQIGAGAGADFTNVGSVAIKIDGSETAGVDMSIAFFEASELDMGDLPSSYNNTLLANNGAGHTIGDLQLGPTIDAEVDGQPEAGAAGDDTLDGNDDEDGIARVNSPWANGSDGAGIQVTTNGSGCLSAWVDWNNNNSMVDDYLVSLDPFVSGNELVLDRQLVASGTNTMTLDVPYNFFGSGSKNVYARFRLAPDYDNDGDCSDQDALALYGIKIGGEVEDYYWEFAPTAVTLSKVSVNAEADNALIVAIIAMGVLGVSLTTVLVLSQRRKAH